MKKSSLLISILFTVLSMQAQTVSTQYGDIQGSADGSVYQFLGIPFASPPVGNLRWKAPQEPVAWSGTLNTTAFAPVCPQKKFEQGSTAYTLEGDEDCLYLNVYTPKLGTDTLPVLVFIHGGGNQQGGAGEEGGGTQMFVGKNMAERGNAVVVTIQYRLGPLGFLAHPGLEPENGHSTSGNYALMDQILALKWVKNNIANFGGDPTKVMVFGESAGGLNVGNLLTSPLAAGLFQRACIQSAMPVISTYNSARTEGVSFVNNYTTTGTDIDKIAFMRTVPADSLIKDETSPISGGMVQQAWKAVVDNYVFTDTPFNAFESGNYNKVPLIIGSNSEEMSLSAPATVTPAMVTLLINSYFTAPNRAAAQALYPPGSSNEEAKASYIKMTSDAQFTLGTRRTAQCVSQNQSQPVYRYFFTHKHTVAALAALGSYHGMELFYVFNTWENATLGSGILFKAADDSVQTNMLKYWVTFANNGNPNGPDLVNWPRYNSATDCYLEIKATPNGNQTGIRKAECDLWDLNTFYGGCSTSVGIANKDLENNLILYPNPTSGNIIITGIEDGSPAQISIYDSTGNMLIQSNKAEIQLKAFPQGIYSVVMEQNGKTRTAKVLKK